MSVTTVTRCRVPADLPVRKRLSGLIDSETRHDTSRVTDQGDDTVLDREGSVLQHTQWRGSRPLGSVCRSRVASRKRQSKRRVYGRRVGSLKAIRTRADAEQAAAYPHDSSASRPIASTVHPEGA